MAILTCKKLYLLNTYLEFEDYYVQFLFFKGVSFDTSLSNLISHISTAIKVFAQGVEDFVEKETSITAQSLVPNLSCESASDQAASQETRWALGETFHQ